MKPLVIHVEPCCAPGVIVQWDSVARFAPWKPGMMQRPQPDFIFSEEETGFGPFALGEDQDCLTFFTDASPPSSALLRAPVSGNETVERMVALPPGLQGQRLSVQGVCANELRLVLPWKLRAHVGYMTKCRCVVPRAGRVSDASFDNFLKEGGVESLVMLASNPDLTDDQIDTLSNCPVFRVLVALYNNPRLPAAIKSNFAPYLEPRQAFTPPAFPRG